MKKSEYYFFDKNKRMTIMSIVIFNLEDVHFKLFFTHVVMFPVLPNWICTFNSESIFLASLWSQDCLGRDCYLEVMENLRGFREYSLRHDVFDPFDIFHRKSFQRLFNNIQNVHEASSAKLLSWWIAVVSEVNFPLDDVHYAYKILCQSCL